MKSPLSQVAVSLAFFLLLNKEPAWFHGLAAVWSA